jgi:hypothetical protein
VIDGITIVAKNNFIFYRFKYRRTGYYKKEEISSPFVLLKIIATKTQLFK